MGSMDRFAALADPTRRHILELLASQGQMSATEIHERFQVSAPAISQHLKVLREANLVLVEKRAQQRIYRFNPEAMIEFEDWVQKLTEQMNARFSALDAILEEEKKKLTQRSDEP